MSSQEIYYLNSCKNMNLSCTSSSDLSKKCRSIGQDLSLVFKTPFHRISPAQTIPNATEEQYLKQKQNMAVIRRQLVVNNDMEHNPLMVIDALQRVGIDHHFKDEIEQVLERHYKETISSIFLKNKDLCFASLCFRLLRQQQYYVPADGFENFMNKEKKLENMSIRQESTKALMSLYEASHLRIIGEGFLDEAELLCCQLLEERTKFMDHQDARTVKNTIAHPHRKSNFAKFTKNQFVKDAIYGKSGCGKVLQELVNVEIDLMQAVHRRELSEFSRWWNALELTNELKLARNQPLKWFTWSMAAMQTDPTLSEERIELTKTISLIYVIDDIFDLYGTIDELILFTEAVERWDIEAVEHLPDYMKKCFRVLYEITNEIGYMVYRKHGLNPVDYLAKTWGRLCIAFLEEAKWFASGYLPEAEEYLKNGITSSGAHVVLIHMFFIIGDGSTKEQADFVMTSKCLIPHVAAILRLWDDLGSAEDENQDGKDGSYVACYMKEHKEASVESARKHVSELISYSWKCLNMVCLSPSPYSKTFIEGSLNLARMVPLMYSYDDSGGLPLLVEYMQNQFLVT